MICAFCGSEMVVDDRDRDGFSVEIYWLCRNCTCSCLECRVFGVSVVERWHFENDGVVDFDRFPADEVKNGSVPGGEDVTD